MIVRTSRELYNLLTDARFEIEGMLPVNQDVMFVTYVEREEARRTSRITSVVIAAYVTCLARLTLFKIINRLGKRTLYLNTDSTVYVSRPGEFDPPEGSFLGNLVDELRN